MTTATGEVTALTHHQYGPFRRLYLAPAEVRERHAGATFVPSPTHSPRASSWSWPTLGGPVVLLALVGAGTPALSPVALLRASLPRPTGSAPPWSRVPLAAHGDPEADHLLGVQVVTTYAGDDPVHALTEPTEDAT